MLGGQMLVLWGFVAVQTRCYILPKCVASVIALSITFWSIRMEPQGVIVGIGIAGVVYAVWCGLLAIKCAMTNKNGRAGGVENSGAFKPMSEG